MLGFSTKMVERFVSALERIAEALEHIVHHVCPDWAEDEPEEPDDDDGTRH